MHTSTGPKSSKWIEHPGCIAWEVGGSNPPGPLNSFLLSNYSWTQ